MASWTAFSMSDIRPGGRRLFDRLAAAFKVRPSTLALLIALLLVGAFAAQIRDLIRGFFNELSQ